MSTLDVAAVRNDFPILGREVNGHPLVYLDSANTSQKPVQVLDVMRDYWERHNANVSRSVHTLGTESTTAYEDARARIARFIGAASPDEVVFTKNSTEAINLVAHSIGSSLGPGDEVVISEMEHHSNIVPWQLLCERTGATLRWFGVTDDGLLDFDESLIGPRTKIVSVVHMSNILGTINDVAPIAARAHEVGALVMLDC